MARRSLLSVLVVLACAVQAQGAITPLPATLVPLECQMHQLAFEYATTILSDKSASSIRDALRLDNCSGHLTAPQRAANAKRLATQFSRPEHITPAAGATVLYVATDGSDSNPGTLASPLKTLGRARDVLRQARALGGATPATVYLRAGKYYLAETLALDERDSNVAWAAYQAEKVTLSGGFVATPTWSKDSGNVYKASITLPPETNFDDNEACNFEENTDLDGHDVETTTASSPSDCCAKCQAHPRCSFFTIEHAAGGTCWLKSSDAGKRSYPDHVSGHPAPGPPPPPPSPPPPSPPFTFGPAPFRINSMFVDGMRMIRARFPNGNPQDNSGLCFSRPQYPTEQCNGHLESGGQIGTLPNPPSDGGLSFPLDRGSSPTLGCPQCSTYGKFSYKFFPPPDGHPVYNKPLPGTGMTNNSVFTFWGSQFARQGGVQSPDLANKTYAHPETGVVHMFMSVLWGSWNFRTTSLVDGNLTFGYGGYQEARGHGQGSNFYIENIREASELDSANEWFFDHNTSTLYFQPNGTAAPPEVVLPVLDRIVNIKGEAAPAKNITFYGLEFTETRTAFLKQYEVPSGGDWSIHRGATLFVETAEEISVEHCTFNQTGGNALMLSNHVSNSTINQNEFVWIGESAIALLGSTVGIDGTNPTFPIDNTVSANHIHETGIFVKQTSCVVQALAGRTTVRDNVCYNGPRAGINWNDGFFGGNVIEGNLVFNCVRETGDHGPYNSWDRQPYLTLNGVDDGYKNPKGASIIKAMDTIRRNFFINGYNGVWTIDHDDGSQFMNDTTNVLLWGGCKNFMGNSKFSNRNLILHPGISARAGGSRRCQTDDNGVFANQYFFDNTCVTEDGDIYTWKRCDTKALNTTVYETYGNVFLGNASVGVQCGSTLTLAQWQALGQDKGSTQGPMPSVATLVADAKAILGM